MVRGRKPQATAAKELSGALRKNPQRRNKHEPKAKLGRPEMPETVAGDEIAAAQWEHLCDVLDEMRILSTADRNLLESYCVTYSEWRKLHRHVTEHGVSIVNDKGNASQSPEAIQYHRFADRLIKLMAELGLTPSSRSRLKAPSDDKDESAFSQLLARMQGNN